MLIGIPLLILLKFVKKSFIYLSQIIKTEKTWLRILNLNFIIKTQGVTINLVTIKLNYTSTYHKNINTNGRNGIFRIKYIFCFEVLSQLARWFQNKWYTSFNTPEWNVEVGVAKVAYFTDQRILHNIVRQTTSCSGNNHEMKCRFFFTAQ